MALSSAKHPVASPGPRIHVGVLTLNGYTLYRVFTLGEAYNSFATFTEPSVNSSYIEVIESASWVMPISFPSAAAPNPIFCKV